jgi:hypothetical protein
MKSLADLKRDITKTKQIILLREPDNPRIFEKIQGTSFKLKKVNGGFTYLEIPKATLLEYDGTTVKIYEPGIRELTAEEQKIRDDEPKDDEQFRIDMLSDGNTMFYRKQRYYKETGLFYLFGTEKEQGKRLTNNKGADGIVKPMIEDDNIKGKLSIEYELKY